MWIKWIGMNWIKQRVESGVNVNKLDFVILSNVLYCIVLFWQNSKRINDSRFKINIDSSTNCQLKIQLNFGLDFFRNLMSKIFSLSFIIICLLLLSFFFFFFYFHLKICFQKLKISFQLNSINYYQKLNWKTIYQFIWFKFIYNDWIQSSWM